MTDRLRPMTLKAHPNVISLAQWRRMRGVAQTDDDAVRIVLCVPPGCFVGWQVQPADDPPEQPRKRSWGFRWPFRTR